MDEQTRALILRYQPHIYKDRLEPFPVRFIGCTVFSEKARSASFPKWEIDPMKEGAERIIEYAIYYDYDIQHMYDLEHIWVAIDPAGNVVDCWCSFHGMRLRAAGIRSFRLEGTHPVLYSQPGKHAMLPHPELFPLHPTFPAACTQEAGGGLLLPGLLGSAVETDALLDAAITEYIRAHFSFRPSMEFIPEPLTSEQFLTWPQLLEKIPLLITEQLQLISPYSSS